MKKLTTLLFASTLLVSFSSVAMAQSSDNETISANATVVQGMVVGGEQGDLDFKNVLVDSWKTIDALDNTARATGGTVNGVTGGESRGFFSIEIVEGTPVDYSLAVPENLVGPGEAGSEATLPIEFNTDNLPFGESTMFNGALTTTDPAVTDDLNLSLLMGGSNNDFSDPTTSPITLNDLAMPNGGKVFLVFGGTVKAADGQALGSYTGDLTLTATVAD